MANTPILPVRGEPGIYKEGQLKLRTSIAAAVAVVSSFALFVPSAHAAGSVCYSVQVTANGSDVVNQAGCQDLP